MSRDHSFAFHQQLPIMSSKTIKNREKSHTTEKTTPVSLMELFMELKLKRTTSLVKWSRAKQGLNNQNQKEITSHREKLL